MKAINLLTTPATTTPAPVAPPAPAPAKPRAKRESVPVGAIADDLDTLTRTEISALRTLLKVDPARRAFLTSLPARVDSALSLPGANVEAPGGRTMPFPEYLDGTILAGERTGKAVRATIIERAAAHRAARLA